MKKKTLLFVALTVMVLGNVTDILAATGYFGTGWNRTGYSPKIVDINFQSWADEPHDPNNPSICPEQVPDNGFYNPHRVINLPVPNTTTFVPFTLDSCLVRNACPPVANSGSKTRNTGVSNGFVELKRYYTGGSTPSLTPGLGHLIIGPISYLEYIQYSTSTNGGNKRGFYLEKSEDAISANDPLATWTVVRRETGNITLSTSKDNNLECSNGMQWEDDINGVDCYLRFSNTTTAADGGAQMIRIHDVKIWGEPSQITGINTAVATQLRASINNIRVKLTDYAEIDIFDISGNKILSHIDTKELNIANIPGGIYIMKAKNANCTLTQKFIK